MNLITTPMTEEERRFSYTQDESIACIQESQARTGGTLIWIVNS